MKHQPLGVHVVSCANVRALIFANNKVVFELSSVALAGEPFHALIFSIVGQNFLMSQNFVINQPIHNTPLRSIRQGVEEVAEDCRVDAKKGVTALLARVSRQNLIVVPSSVQRIGLEAPKTLTVESSDSVSLVAIAIVPSRYLPLDLSNTQMFPVFRLGTVQIQKRYLSFPVSLWLMTRPWCHHLLKALRMKSLMV
jgi:hypothetical protein